jgi:hypothetical protein
MTTNKEPKDAATLAMEAGARYQLTLCFEMACDNGGLDAGLAVLRSALDGVDAHNNPPGQYLNIHWRGLDVVEKMFPGATADLKKYAYLNAGADIE